MTYWAPPSLWMHPLVPRFLAGLAPPALGICPLAHARPPVTIPARSLNFLIPRRISCSSSLSPPRPRPVVSIVDFIVSLVAGYDSLDSPSGLRPTVLLLQQSSLRNLDISTANSPSTPPNSASTRLETRLFHSSCFLPSLPILCEGPSTVHRNPAISEVSPASETHTNAPSSHSLPACPPGVSQLRLTSTCRHPLRGSVIFFSVELHSCHSTELFFLSCFAFLRRNSVFSLVDAQPSVVSWAFVLARPIFILIQSRSLCAPAKQLSLQRAAFSLHRQHRPFFVQSPDTYSPAGITCQHW